MSYRKVIPEELRPWFGKTAIKKSFKTTNPADARVLHHQVSAQVEAQIAHARAQLRGETVVSEPDLHHMADLWRAKKLTEWQDWGKLRGEMVESIRQVKEGHAPILDAEHRFSFILETPPEANSLKTLRTVLGEDAEGLLREEGKTIRPDSELYHKLLILLADRATRLTSTAANLYDQTQAVANDQTGTKGAPLDTPQAFDSLTLSQLWDRYERHYGSSNSKKDRDRVDNYRGVFAKLIDHSGNVRLSMLDSGHARSLRDALREAPDTTAKGFSDLAGMKVSAFRALPLTEQVHIAQERGLPLKTATGVITTLKKIAAVLTFAEREGYTSQNILSPLPDVPHSKNTHSGDTKAYSRDEIHNLLTSDTFLASFKTDELWFVLTLYFTGARREELAHLIGADVLATEGVECLDIREDMEQGRTTKNDNSTRKVPIHPTLKALGFLDYTKGQAEDAPLFPHVYDRKGNRVNSLARRIKKAALGQGIRETVAPTHGFRHHAITLWREAGTRQDEQDRWMGHAAKTTQAGYGNYSGLLVTASKVWPDLPDKEKLLAHLWP